MPLPQVVKGLNRPAALTNTNSNANCVYGSEEALGLLKESLGIASARDGTATGGLT